LRNVAGKGGGSMPEGGALRIGLKELSLQADEARPVPEMKPGAWVRITFEDTGSGISEADLPYVFEPFYSTKGLEGTGLGLAQVFGIIRQHDGFILAESPPSGGACFTIYLPRESGRAEDVAPPELEPLEQGRGELILVVEDNVATRQALCEILEMLNYRPVEAENGLRALEVLESRRDIALVISDMVMPQMGGKALHEMVMSSYPSIRMILMTGYPLGEEDRALLSRKGVVWLGKPLGPELLAQSIRRALDSSP
jgi:CheY-like chemotaxis protein